VPELTPSYYPQSIAVSPYDVVWCRWPTNVGEGGFKDRPALVRSVRQKDGNRALEVAYGTSKLHKPYVSSFYVANLTDMNAAGLFLATRFELDLTLLLPFAEDYFPKRPDGVGPVIGRLSSHSVDLLKQMLKR
jgi:hypothetical protein